MIKCNRKKETYHLFEVMMQSYLYAFNTHTIRIISAIRILYGDNAYCRFALLSKVRYIDRYILTYTIYCGI